MLDTVLRFVLPLYALFAIAAIAARRSRILKETGYDPVVMRPFQNNDTSHDYLVSMLFLGVLVLIVDVVLNTASPRWVSEQLAVPVLRQATLVRWFGLGAMTCGLLLSSAAVRNMGTSWRMGIDREKPGPLVTSGLFARMRHPIYAGMLLVTSGMAAATADLLAAAVAAAAWVGISIEARLEEQFLLSFHGEEYRRYLARTGRFWPTAPH